MAILLYSTLGMDKKLRDIVFAGSHDAGITTGGNNAQTQFKEILGQARSGVRLFDLRIMAGTVGSGTDKKARLMAYHSGGGIKKETKTRVMEATGNSETIVRSKLRVGNWGLGLEGMLTDARAFVEKYGSEFLILKFDKCTNWELIAEYCIRVLGGCIYTDGGDINRKTLQELKGKVIVLFSGDGIKAVKHIYTHDDGILGFKNLFSKDEGPKDYDAKFNGLQYFGKGGTSTNIAKMKWNYSGKISENIEKQGDLRARPERC